MENKKEEEIMTRPRKPVKPPTAKQLLESWTSLKYPACNGDDMDADKCAIMIDYIIEYLIHQERLARKP